MVNKKNLVVACLLIAGGIIAFSMFFQSDEAKIKKKFHALSKSIAKKTAENELMAAGIANKTKRLFAESCRIEIPSYSVDKTFPNNEISLNVLYARARYQKISLEFFDFQFQFPEEGLSTVDLTAVFKAMTNLNESVFEIHELEYTLKKIENEWLFTGIKGVDVLER